MNEVNKRVREVGLSKWRKGMERMNTLVWYRSKERPKYEKMYDGGFGSELLFRAKPKCMEVNEKTYRRSESGSKACVMCDGGEDECVGHLVLVCGRHEKLRENLMDAVGLEVEAWVSGVKEWTTEEWTRTLLGLSDRVSDCIVGVG